jgi:hypothetical protein
VPTGYCDIPPLYSANYFPLVARRRRFCEPVSSQFGGRQSFKIDSNVSLAHWQGWLKPEKITVNLPF